MSNSDQIQIFSSNTERLNGSNFNLNWIGFLLPIIAFLLYFNTINHGYVLDDELVCNKNGFVQKEGMSGLYDIFTSSFHQGFTNKPDLHYRPMMMAAFTIEKSIFGNKNTVFHFFNIFWFAVSAGLLFIFLRQIFKEKSLWLSFGIALLFISHPIHTEVVANIKSRDEIFVFIGLLGTLISILKYQNKKNPLWLFSSLLFYLFAILAKETGLQIIALVPLTLYFFHKEIEWKSIMINSCFFILPLILYFYLRHLYTADNGYELNIIDNTLLAANSIIEQLSTAISMIGKYFQLLIFPKSLSYDYSAYQIPIVGLFHWKTICSILAIILSLFVAFKGLKEKSPISYGILFFYLMFALVSNVVFLTGVTMAERLIFSASLGFSIITGYIIFHYLFENKKPILYFFSIGIMFLIYSFITVNRNTVWESNATLFLSGISSAPNSSRTLSFFGRHLYDTALKETNPKLQEELINESILYFEKAIRIHNGFTDVHHQKGVSQDFLKQYDEAMKSYEDALFTKPDYHLSICNLGLVHYKQGNNVKALEYLNRAHHISPNNETIKKNLIIVSLNQRDVLRNQGDIENAILLDKQVRRLRGQNVK